MRFGRTLHPEIVLNKRGSKNARDFYSLAMNMIDITPGGVAFKAQDTMSAIVAEGLARDPVFLRFTANCKIFKERNAPVYHIGREFLQALQKIDRAIPVDLLPEKFSAYFSFSNNTVFDDDAAVEGGYVSIDRGRNLGMISELADTRVISFTYVCQSTEELPPCGSLTVPLDAKRIEELASEVLIEDFLFSHEVLTPERVKKRNDVFRALLNAVIYIHSEDPIVERTKPLQESGLSVKQHKNLGHIINACTIPVSFLYPNYVQKKIYRVDSTWIESFPRWQRCGPGLTRVKLVFVTPHERNYSTGKSYEGQADNHG